MQIINKDDIQRVNSNPGTADSWRLVFDKYEDNFDLIVDAINSLNSKIATESFEAASNQTVFLLSGHYQPRTNSLIVYINGARQFLGEGFTETSSSSFTLATPSEAGDDIQVVYTNFTMLDSLPILSSISNGSQVYSYTSIEDVPTNIQLNRVVILVTDDVSGTFKVVPNTLTADDEDILDLSDDLQLVRI